ncbi:MAG: NADP-dependent malic enzyme, partial [Zetaproteobacteria bacterium]|nr:NADP-dependent malic enzyme [Zetaproteobacteria bacterium]
FAMANPTPEIAYDLAKATRADLIMATGRSDHPNQVNNVLGFPFLFRGALDARATTFNTEMKIAAVHALAKLARKDVPSSVLLAYGKKSLRFGPDYILPTPFDPRLIETIPTAVAHAATETGVARNPITDLQAYAQKLSGRIDQSRSLMRLVLDKARQNPLRMVLPEGEDPIVIRAATIMRDEGISRPILIGEPKAIAQHAQELHLQLDNIEIIDPNITDSRFESLADAYYFDRNRHGVLRQNALDTLKNNRNIFASMLVRRGFADGLLAGRNSHYADVLRPVLQILAHNQTGAHLHTFGLYILVMESGAYILGDCTANLTMDAQKLSQLAVHAADLATSLGMEPRVGMLSYSNFGSAQHDATLCVAEAVKILHRDHPNLMVDGEMQADTAINQAVLNNYPFSKLKNSANILIFPDMQSGNIAYKLLRELGNATAIGPVLVGLPKQAHILQTGASTDDIVNMAALAAARTVKSATHS